jgi:hypothetical protein
MASLNSMASRETLSIELGSFKNCVIVHVGLDEGTWFVENEAFSLFGHGRTKNEAIAEFIQDLDYLTSRYRAMNDQELSAGAKELKSLLATLTI